jgi:SpoIID/LytB domain
MIKRKHKKSAALLLIFIIILSSVSFTNAEYKIPETVKVGLYYSDTSAHVNTAVSSFTVNAAAGLSIGFFKDNSFSEIIRASSGNNLNVRKDSYFVNSNGTYKEYNPSNTTASGDIIGPYHIILGRDYPDQATTNAKVQENLQKGIVSYPAFVGSWQVWTGFFADQQTAQLYMQNNIIPVLGEGTYEIVMPASNRITVFDTSNKPICIFGDDTSYFRIKPAPENNPNVFAINGNKYRGSLEVRRLTDSDMTVINVVSLQEYLYGNVPPEIGGKSHPEALKAQALASKMYAINNIGKHGKTGFDLCTTTSCQVYKGYSVEIASCNAAIDDVKDKIITYNGKLAGQIYYFASSGGRTEDVANVWGGSVPYLKSVEDKYEKIYSWTQTLRASDINAKIPSLGHVLGMSILDTSEAGRVTKLAVRGDKRNDPVEYNRNNCSSVFGLKSQLYTITSDADIFIASNPTTPAKAQLGGKKAVSSASVMKTITSSNNKVYVIGANGQKKTVALVPETYTFSGKGWGHAVGMSQEGAKSMGNAGINYADILTHYFPGTNIE